MTDKAQARILFFAAHWGQECRVSDGPDFKDINVSPFIMDQLEYEDTKPDEIQLRLKPLSEMTEEEQNKLGKLIPYDGITHQQLGVIISDFRRAYGYYDNELFMGYDPIAEGWAVLTTELKEKI